MTAKIFLIVCATFVITGTHAEVTKEDLDSKVVEGMQILCKKNSDTATFESVVDDYKTALICVPEDRTLEKLHFSDSSLAPSARLDALYTAICGDMEVKVKCMEDFSASVKRCMTDAEFISYAASSNSTFDYYNQMCKEDTLKTVKDFVMHNGLDCFDKSKSASTKCIEHVREEKENHISKQEVETLAEKCFKLVPCEAMKKNDGPE